MAIEIKVLQRGDESILTHVAAEVFDNPIDAELTREFLADARHHIAVVLDGGLVVGFASGVHYLHPDKPAELWVNEVALAPTHRRRGLGKAVLKALLDVGRVENCRVAWVLTDRNNVAAMALYSSIGGAEGADDVGPADAMLGYSFALAGGTVSSRVGKPTGRLRMVREAKVHTTILVTQGILMIALGLALFWVRSTMTNIVFEATGTVVAVLLTAAGLLLIGVIDGIGGLALHHGHRRELHFYLFFAALAMGAGLFFWLSPWGSVQMLAVLAGLHGLIWGGWDLRFASHLCDHPRERKAMRLMGAITLALGALLVIGMELTSRGALLLLAAYVTYIGIHILLIGLYIYHPWKKVLPPGKHMDPLSDTKLV